MRSTSRVVSTVAVLALVLAPVAIADHLVADCPLTLVGQASAAGDFDSSPHGIFKNGSVVYSLQGRTLTTFDVTATGELSVAREDLLGNLAANDVDGGVTYSNGFLFITSGNGLEIYDLRNTHGGSGGEAPVRVSRTLMPHYREIAVQGNVLAGLFPADELPCIPNGTAACANAIDLWSIANLGAPTLVSSISSANATFRGFNDIAFVNGFLYATGFGGTHAWNVSNPMAPVGMSNFPTQGAFLVTNGTNLLGIGQETLVGVFLVGPGPDLGFFVVHTLPTVFDHSNSIRFNHDAWIDSSRLITLIDEVDPMTRESARTIAFDVFDFSVPFVNGSFPRLFENISYTRSDEVLHSPVAVGPMVYVSGEMTGAQIWGACGQLAGEIELDRVTALPCGGAEIRGWVSGQHGVSEVELFLDNTSLGFATIGTQRTDITSSRPVWNWAVNVELDDTPAGEHILRAIATDRDNNRRQIASEMLNFPGPGDNCVDRRKGIRR